SAVLRRASRAARPSAGSARPAAPNATGRIAAARRREAGAAAALRASWRRAERRTLEQVLGVGLPRREVHQTEPELALSEAHDLFDLRVLVGIPAEPVPD